MKGFFDKVGKDVSKALNKNSNNNYRGGGQALGGSKPGEVLKDIYIVETGPLGIKLENTSQNHAIIASVSPGSVAASVGLQRGDIICHPDSDGMNEMQYQEFLSLARSSSRPIRIDVRRMVDLTTSKSGKKSATAATASNNASSTRDSTNVRADVDARRRAVIAAAEQRNSKHKAKTRPIPKKKGGKVIEELTPEQLQKIEQQKEENIQRNAVQMANKPMSDEAKRAVTAAKYDEAKHAQQLGYNPYEVKKVTAGQASTASIAMTHGAISAGTGGDIGLSAAPPSTSIPAVRPPTNAMIPTSTHVKPVDKPIDSVFDEAFKELINSNDGTEKVSKSLRILRKLTVNATNSPPGDPKRNVRISDPNNLINSCVIEMTGAIELLMSVGFVMSEIDGKTFLVYNGGDSDDVVDVSWLPDALEKMEQYETYLANNKSSDI